ncbi:MAG: DUF721 domain-containing protein, partial [Pseudomonadota bacterium]
MKKPTRITSLNDILNSLLHTVKFESRMEHVMLRDTWSQAVGQRIAENTTPASLRSGVLFVNVSNSVWMQELNFMKDKILEKINSSLASQKFKEIRFKIGHVPGFGRKAFFEPLPSLNEQETQKIEVEAAPIEDSELK